jgi:hypothetical protein
LKSSSTAVSIACKGDCGGESGAMNQAPLASTEF